MNRHARLIKLGLDTDTIIATRLINAYICCSQAPDSLSHAHRLFDQVPSKDTVLWTSLISAYSRSNLPHTALQLFSLMLRQPDSAHPPNHFVFSAVAHAIASSPEYLQLGQTIHSRVIKSGFIPDNVVLETALLDMYSKCGVVNCARKLFDEMPFKNLVTLNSMISGFLQYGMEIHGLELFYQMKCREFYIPDGFTLATVLVGCAWTQYLILGAQVHGYTIVSGFESNCANSIGNMYFQCGNVSSAEKALDGVETSVISKLIKIRGYVFNKRYYDAIAYVASADKIAEIFEVDYTMIVPLLTACANLSLLKVGRQVHGLLIALYNSFLNAHLLEEGGAIIGSALIDMYSKCGSISEARTVFETWMPGKSVSHWNSMISGYVYNGLTEDARTLLEEMPEKNVVSWTSMISGYVQNGMPQEGLSLLVKMYCYEELRVQVNCLTFVAGLSACSCLTDLERGKQLHAKLIRTVSNAYVCNVAVGTALVDLYSKSGFLKYGQTVFHLMLEKNVVTWTSIISGYALHGYGFRALEIFQKMMDMGLEPNEVTFVSVLTACSHCGLVDKGVQYFKLMREKYGLSPKEDHYTCLIDMLGRAGRLEEAWSFLEEIESGELGKECSYGTVWAAMLGACQLHENVEMGRRVAKKMLDTNKDVSTTYITLSNVYAAAGMWNDTYRVRESWRREGHAIGEPGLSRICTNLVRP